MTLSNDTLWKTKLTARLHDPAEKALVLLRDPAGHENGTSRALLRLLGLEKLPSDQVEPDTEDALANAVMPEGVGAQLYRHVQRADWWASAADRPQWPMETIDITDSRGQERSLRIAPWAQVRWSNEPVLIHPLSGDNYDLKQHGGLRDTDFHDIKIRSRTHHEALLQAIEAENPGEARNWRRMLLTIWRFGAQVVEDDDFGKLGALWKLLPADTRVPDHSIWDHLDLTSAFAGAFSADPENQAALMTLSIGPVQSFIAAGRKMEDLWAGSHLLSRLSWEAMKMVCERYGPDAILFPRLRGVPQVDLWLRDECGVPAALFEGCDWTRARTDGNPLFTAALPNRFVAIVPESDAQALTQDIRNHVRQWIQELGDDVVRRLLATAGIDNDESLYCHEQIAEQLADFPEVHWAIVPFSLIATGNQQRQTDLDVTELSAAMRPFFGIEQDEPPGFLASKAWQLLQKDLVLNNADDTRSIFFSPNPGVLYPAVYDLAERALAAAKAVRPFRQSIQQGWRCTLSAESEWLATEQRHLWVPAGRRRLASDPQFDAQRHCETLWLRVARAKPAWARKGEHLGALSAIKRLWPSLFAEEVGRALKRTAVDRFVVSTHTMSLVHQLDGWLAAGAQTNDDALDGLLEQYQMRLQPAALPRKLMRTHAGLKTDELSKARLLPALLDLAAEGELDEEAAQKIRVAVRKILSPAREEDARLETYYSLVMLDGDSMGAWLSSGGGMEDTGAKGISYLDSFHPRVRAGFEKQAAVNSGVERYGKQLRALSPNRHLAISGALNDFSLTVVRHVIEHEHHGRLIYAGGDDVFAMLPVADALPAMQRMRHAYSGHDPEHKGGVSSHELILRNGFAYLRGELMRMMGRRATASAAVVIAHHQAPLAVVRRELELAEQRAKHEGGRDAFSIVIIKRAGGALYLTDKWGEPFVLLQDLRDFFQSEDVSRRAAYRILQWLDDRVLPQQDGAGALLRSMLGFQLGQQSRNDPRCADLARRLSDLARSREASWSEQINWLRNFISVAEFMAREVRAPIAVESS